jgi:hypothetical protein
MAIHCHIESARRNHPISRPTAPRLRAYVRRTVLASAREYAYPAKRRTVDSTRSAFRDAMHGTDTGWWSDLIYTRDVLALFNRHRSDVADTIREYLADTGADASQHVKQGDNERRAVIASATCLAISFAVEFLTGEVASEMGVDL